MGRPIKDGVDYWPFDVGFLRDKKIKLIKAEFGIKGVYIALELLNSVYESAGYFKKWDDDDCFLMSEGVGCGCTPEYISEVVHGCVRRSLFDKGVSDLFGVLTSAGIQRRYLRIVGNSRDEIRICREYWLLNEGDKKDVPASVLNKIIFFSVSGTENGVSLKENPVNLKDNPQSKVKKRKGKESKENKIGVFEKYAGGCPELLNTLLEFEKMRKSIQKPMTDRAKEMIWKELNQLSRDHEVQIRILEQSILHNWQSVYPLKTKSICQTAGKETDNIFFEMIQEENHGPTRDP